MKKSIFILLGALIFTASCSLLDQAPTDKLVREDFWQSEADVESSVIGCYNRLQSVLDELVVWGESRSGYIEYVGVTSSIKRFNDQNIDANNGFVSWGGPYDVINYANTIIRFAPQAKESDNLYTQKSLDNHLGECYYLKGLMHFYLIRSFIEIPYADEPYDNDGQDFYLPLMDRDSVFTKIEDCLLTAKSLLNQDYTEPYNVKGRVSSDAVNATLADLYLWTGEYQKALNVISELESKYELESADNLFNVFYEGNNQKESIFEIQFTEEFNDLTPSALWNTIYLRTSLEPNRNVIWPAPESSLDRRVTISLLQNGPESDDPFMQWKYIAQSAEGAEEYSDDKRTNRESNWIMYRYADVVLMKAEALCNIKSKGDAIETLNLIRSRAGVSQYDTDSEYTVRELDELILDERGRELAFEGKRWYDLVRVALRHGDLYSPSAEGNTILTSRLVLQKTEENDRNTIEYIARIDDPRGWFLPIHYNELKANPSLRQFDYYDDKY